MTMGGLHLWDDYVKMIQQSMFHLIWVCQKKLFEEISDLIYDSYDEK